MDIKTDLLPLGSVVKLKGQDGKIIIFKRNVLINENTVFDYGASKFPLGLYGRRMEYFQSTAIEKVYFKGYQDERDIDFQKSLSEEFEDVSLKEYAKKHMTWKQKLRSFFHIY